MARAIQQLGDSLAKDPRILLIDSGHNKRRAPGNARSNQLWRIACDAKAGRLPFINEFMKAVSHALVVPNTGHALR